MFSFPLLRLSEITACLHELDIPATEEELVHSDKHRDAVSARSPLRGACSTRPFRSRRCGGSWSS